MLAIMAFYAENYKKGDKIFYLFIRNYMETIYKVLVFF